jgi:ABC-type branched-subunit amino acid transport system ATPase component
VARTFQITQTFPRFSVAETVLTAALARHREPAARPLAERVLDRVGLGARRAARAASLTLAEQRRLEIAKALATEPRVLLLDEVMAGLTPVEMDDAIRLIGGLREEGMTVIVIEHVIRAVMRLCDRVLVLDAGEVVGLGSPAEVARDPRVIEAYLGTPSGEPHRSAAVAVGEGRSSAAARRRER